MTWLALMADVEQMHMARVDQRRLILGSSGYPARVYYC